MIDPTPKVASAAATRVRYTVLGLLCLLAMITYLVRAVIGSAGGDVMAAVGHPAEDFFWMLVAFQLAEDRGFDEFDIASQLAAERGWMVPAYTMPPNAQHVTIMRALVKLTLGHTLVTTLADDIAQACQTLKTKGGLHELDRKRVKTSPSY